MYPVIVIISYMSLEKFRSNSSSSNYSILESVYVSNQTLQTRVIEEIKL